MRVAISTAALLLALVASTQAQTVKEPTKLEVDNKEVGRRGDFVEHVGGGIEDFSPSQAGFAQMVRLPDGDANKWQFWILGMKNCPGCEQLKGLLGNNKTMRYWVCPESPKESWANYHYFDKDEKRQQFRWAKMKITGYPTIFVQPPRNAAYGNPNAVVIQYLWDGDPENFDTRLRESLKAYYATLQARKESTAKNSSAGFEFVQASLSSPVPAKSAGVGDQQFPPLDLPGEPKEPAVDDAPPLPRERPVRDLVAGALRKPEIIIVRDPEIESAEGEEQAVDEAIESLQPRGKDRYAVRRLDPAKAAARYGSALVAAEDGPLVLKVEGRRIIEKHVCHPYRDPRIDEPKTFVMTGCLFFAAWLMGGVAKGYFMAKVMNFVIWALIVIVAIIGVCYVLGQVSKRSAAMGAAAGSIDPETLALAIALQAQQKAVDSTKVAGAAKP